ncbi:MAG: hypothetical protein FWG00_05835 [Coriobacteriia bacterium]|nr:hypothetical protein [Coriobacteriia bacterium]
MKRLLTWALLAPLAFSPELENDLTDRCQGYEHARCHCQYRLSVHKVHPLSA